MNKDSSKKMSRILFCIGILLFISEVWKQIRINCILRVGAGTYCWWYFPFQLCSTPMYACLLLPLARKWKVHSAEGPGQIRAHLWEALLTYLVCYGLLAGVFTFFDVSGFSELGDLPLCIHSWIWHVLLILIGLWTGWNSTEFMPDFAGATALYCCGIGLAQLINTLAGRSGIINMFYMNPRLKMAQAYFSEIADYVGNGLGITVYAASIAVGAAAIHILLLTVRMVRITQR